MPNQLPRTRGPQSAAEREMSRAKMRLLNATRFADSSGMYLTAKGYLRLSKGPDRGKFVHRVVMAEMCREQCWWPVETCGIPAGMTVDHMDWRKDHNCPSNLLLLQREIHDYISRAMWRNGQYVRNGDGGSYYHSDGTTDSRAVTGADDAPGEPPF